MSDLKENLRSARAVDMHSFKGEIDRVVTNAIYHKCKGSSVADQQYALEVVQEVFNAKDHRLFELLQAVAVAAEAIREIGKRDTSNPKYDGYFEERDDALAALKSHVAGEGEK